MPPRVERSGHGRRIRVLFSTREEVLARQRATTTIPFRFIEHFTATAHSYGPA